jgi:amino acid permease
MILRYRTLTAAIIAVLGVLAIIAAVIYLTTAGKSLPSILGQVHGYTGHRSKRGIAALVVGIVLLVIAGGLALYRPRPRA